MAQPRGPPWRRHCIDARLRQTRQYREIPAYDRLMKAIEHSWTPVWPSTRRTHMQPSHPRRRATPSCPPQRAVRGRSEPSLTAERAPSAGSLQPAFAGTDSRGTGMPAGDAARARIRKAPFAAPVDHRQPCNRTSAKPCVTRAAARNGGRGSVVRQLDQSRRFARMLIGPPWRLLTKA
jgi:hypothetical protein